MSFLRQGARDQLWRWREAIVGGGLMALGLWLVAGPGFLLAVPGYAALAGGAALIWLGVQRARFRHQLSFQHVASLLLIPGSV